MSNVEVSRSRLTLLCLAICVGLFAAIAPATATAEDTVWICKPGQVDDLCAGTIEGMTDPPPGQSARPLGYTRPANAPVDCFYLYPTQSDQPGPNADLAKDPPIRRVVVQQARMFSSVCNVYAPMYRQVTSNGDQTSYNASVETAYQSAKAGFEDFLRNHNGRRGFIMLGHSQGAAHTARLIAELIDPDPKLRKRFVGAIAPGANISVPIGGSVGGLFENVPACTKVGQYGCVTAYSTFNDVPGPLAPFSRLDFGYWIYPEPRPSARRYEVICTNPAQLDGDEGVLEPLVNFDYLLSTPASETAAPWRGQPEYYRAECRRQDGAHWLHLSKVGLPGDTRPDLGAAVASGSNYHVPEVNLAEGNLLRIARLQTEGFQADVAALRAKLKAVKKKLNGAKKRLASYRKQARKLSGTRKAKRLRKQARAERKRIKSLKQKAGRLAKQLP